MNPTDEFNEAVESRLDHLAVNAITHQSGVHFNKLSVGERNSRMMKDRAEALASIQASALEYFTVLIGENEKGERVQVPCPALLEGCLVYHTDFKMTHRIKHRNELRRELKAKIDQLIEDLSNA